MSVCLVDKVIKRCFRGEWRAPPLHQSSHAWGPVIIASSLHPLNLMASLMASTDQPFFFYFFCLFWIVLESFRILLYKLQKIANKVIHLRWAYTNKKCKQWTNKSLRNKAMPLYYHCQSHERYIQEERNVTFYFVFSITYTLVSVN